MPEHSPKKDPLWARSQSALIDFLNADLDLAFTFLQTATIDMMDDPEGCELALAKAQAALDTIRRLEGSITSTVVWREIHARAEELEAALGSFQTWLKK